ncbi:hypothetical protein [Streptomyces sp. NPDC051677]|uniref:hypothetical protein n=1 Tax=Streptomyces sp. NPDC051677 TaxID=3365669 RepID=UPI0037D5FAED
MRGAGEPAAGRTGIAGPVCIGAEPLAATGRVGSAGAGGVFEMRGVAARCPAGAEVRPPSLEAEPARGPEAAARSEVEPTAVAARCTVGDDARPASFGAELEVDPGAEVEPEPGPVVEAEVRPLSLKAGAELGPVVEVGVVAVRWTTGDDVRPLLPGAGVSPELRVADDPVRASAGAGRPLAGWRAAAAGGCAEVGASGVGDGLLLGGVEAVRSVTARCTLCPTRAAGDPAGPTGGTVAAVDAPGDGELPDAEGEASVVAEVAGVAEVAVVAGDGRTDPVGTAGVPPPAAEGPMPPEPGAARRTRTGSGLGAVGREPPGPSSARRGIARWSPTGC